MKPVVIVNPENGWDSIVCVLDGEEINEEQWEQLEEVCSKGGMIAIDWHSKQSVESFLSDYHWVA